MSRLRVALECGPIEAHTKVSELVRHTPANNGSRLLLLLLVKEGAIRGADESSCPIAMAPPGRGPSVCPKRYPIMLTNGLLKSYAPEQPAYN